MEAEITEEDRTNETGLFYTAETYWKSANALDEAKVNATHAKYPVLFLYYHAIELYLKAFLRGNGHSARELSTKKFGHDIEKLTTRAAQLGLCYADEDKDVFRMMSGTDAVIRYSHRVLQRLAVAGSALPHLLQFEAECREGPSCKG